MSTLSSTRTRGWANGETRIRIWSLRCSLTEPMGCECPIARGTWPSPLLSQFSHLSVKEFLTSDRLAAVGDISFHHIMLEPAHTILAQACLGVLLGLDDSTRETSVQRFPLAEYAARHWVDHSLFENVSLRIKVGMENLFDPEKPHFSRWTRIHDMDDNPWGLADGETRPERLEAAPVDYATLGGVPDVV